MKAILIAALMWAASLLPSAAYEKTVVFVGSSSIARWTTLEQDFPGFRVINQGINKHEDRGALISDLSVDRDILPHNPSTVVIYAGENDLWSGLSPGHVSCALDEFIRSIGEARPDTGIVIISVKTAPSRQEKQAEIQWTNRFLRHSCEQSGECQFVPAHMYMFRDGEPNADYFDTDMLHLSSKGYDLWKKMITPLLK